MGGPLTSGKVNAAQTGIDSFNSAKVNDMLGLYQKERGMSPTQAASQIAYTNGIAVAVKNGKETEIFGSDGKVAMTTGQTVQNGYTENWVKDGKGNMIFTTGNAGSKLNTDHINNRTNENLTTNKYGSQTWTGDSTVHDTSTKNISGTSSVIDNSTTDKSGTFYQTPEYSANQAFLNDGSYIHNYAKYSPGGAGVISGMKAKNTGAFAEFNKNTQGMLNQYGGNVNTLTFSANAKDKLVASAGFDLLGNEAKDKITASVGVDGQSMIQANALRTDVGNQLTHYAGEYKNGKISWSQYQNDANGLVSTYKTLINVGSAPSAATAVNLGRNAINAGAKGASKQEEIKNLSNELTAGKITQAQYIKDAEKIGEGNHKL